MGLAERIVSMLRVRSSEALPDWLMQALDSMYPRSKRRLLRIHPGRAARNRDVPRFAAFSMNDGNAPGPAAIADDMLGPIGSAAPLWIAPGEARALLTLASAGEVRYLLEMEGAGRIDASSDLPALAVIASRYYERLLDFETDPLTRLYNRRAFHSHVEVVLRRAHGGARYVAKVDSDHFKRVNDRLGHLYGDEILVRFGALLRDTLREGDFVYRFGGEEFVVVFEIEREADPARTLERLREAVQRYDFPGVGEVTVSIGYARVWAGGSTPAATLIDRADQALYFAKGHGRNQVHCWEALVAEGSLKLAAPAADVTLF